MAPQRDSVPGEEGLASTLVAPEPQEPTVDVNLDANLTGGATATSCNDSLPITIAAGATFSCEITATLTGNAGDTHVNTVSATVEDDEANSNFGFNLPWWDRLFGTYRDQPRRGHEGMTIGIHHHFRNGDLVGNAIFDCAAELGGRVTPARLASSSASKTISFSDTVESEKKGV